jgi:RHS repeat-associated protein
VATLARETHASAPVPAGGLKVQVSLAFSDGFGREIQKKIEAEPGPLTPGGPDAPRWVGNGWAVFNNKGLPVKQYEPFFTASSDFEFGRQVGISATMFYDPLGRTVGTLHPNHSYEKILYGAWRQETWDVNDTVLRPDPENDPNIGPFLRRLDPAEYLPTWYEMRATGDLGDEEQDAAEKAEVHDSTPSIAHLDALGRTFLTIAQNRFLRNGAPVNESHPTRVDLDILGNQKVLFDSQRDPVSSPLGRSVIRYDYNLLNMSIHQLSMEAGERWTLPDVTGEPIRNWDGLGRAFRTEYDALRRMSRSFSRGADPRYSNREILIERVIYGEAANTGLTTSQVVAANLRGKPYLYYDGAGLITSDSYDFKGNRLRQRRRLARDYKGVLDWSANPVMENREYITTTEYDALNRWTQLTHPDRSVLRPAYNEANLLTSVTVRVRGSPNSNSVVSEIRYDAKGQREWVRFGSGMETRYFYDPDTLRLTGLQTRRNPGPEILQDLRYTYDPAGNITFIRDRAQQTVFFRNRRVEPSNDYTYDALYRLIEARGREHLGQAGGAFFPVPPDAGDAFHSNRPLPGDGNAMGTYREQYRYDPGGNLAEIRHVLLDPAHPGWVRSFVCQEVSLLDGNQRSNRLTSSRMAPSGQNPVTESFSYDRHGNMSRVPHLSLLQWNHRDQLAATARQVVTAGTTETTYYGYDAGGTRIRKVTERSAAAGAVPRRLREWIFLDGFDIEREYGGDGQTIVAERETVTVMDDKKNVAFLETQTVAAGAAVANPATSTRYPVGNHLGSSALELDRQGRLLSYEEYYPYGGTSYQGVAAGTGAFRKRFRYTGRERDVESGFYYHGARYYAPWLGRWISCDPLGVADGNNLYAYALADPIAGMDPSGTQVQSGVRLNPEAYSGSLLAPETEEEPPPAEAEPAPEPSPDFTWETYANLPEEYRFPFYTFGVYDSSVDLTTAYHYSKVKQALDTLFSGSVVVSPEDRVFAVPEALWHELSYLASGTVYMSEHVVGSVFELVGQGYAAMENLIPGFNMTMESLMGVPFLGPEVGALRMAAQASRFSFAMKLQKLLTARAINSAPMHRIYFGLTAQEVAALGKTGHVLHVEHLDSALEFWVHSGAGGPIGHTEYGAALFLRELGLLEKGQSFLLRGIWAPCQRGASNCSALLDYLSKAKGVNFMYLYSGDALVPGARTASGGIPVRGISWFEGGRGRFLKSQGTFSGGAKYPTHIVNDFK